MFDDLRRRYVDLAQPRLGSEVVYATDDFFGDRARLISPDEPQVPPGGFEERGGRADGWASRRRRGPGHDWCVVRFGVPGIVAGFEIDTRGFTGAFPPACALEVCRSDERVPGEAARWVRITERLELKGGSRIYAPVEYGTVTHVRLSLFPDGGVARLRAWGHVAPDWGKHPRGEPLDLLALAHGGRGVIASDEHYGAMANLTAPGGGADTGLGWQTRRRREAGHDWAILELGTAGVIQEVVVDTFGFEGACPDRCSIQATANPKGSPEEMANAATGWPILLPEVKLTPDTAASFRAELRQAGAVRFVRLNIYPDGGVSRLRLIGTLA